MAYTNIKHEDSTLILREIDKALMNVESISEGE